MSTQIESSQSWHYRVRCSHCRSYADGPAERVVRTRVAGVGRCGRTRKVCDRRTRRRSDRRTGDRARGFHLRLQEDPAGNAALGLDVERRPHGRLRHRVRTRRTELAPSTFTTSIFGINGNVNVRGIPSDTYFRGVKRLENTQLFPSPITAMGRLEVVRGPPSPIYGPGKVGGYTNFVPKSARASTGKYLGEADRQSCADRAASLRQEGAFVRRSAGRFRCSENRAATSCISTPETPTRTTTTSRSISNPAVLFRLRTHHTMRLEMGQMYQYWGGTRTGRLESAHPGVDRHRHVQRRRSRAQHGPEATG